jgi:hypothetical protein
VGGRFRGYRTDKSGQPTFMYGIAGVDVEETPLPVLRKGGPVLVRKFALKGQALPAGLTFLAASGGKIEPASGAEGAWVVDDKVTIRVDPKLKPVVRDSVGARQLLVPVPAAGAGGEVTFEVEMAW